MRRTIVTSLTDPHHVLPHSTGQRSASFVFELMNGSSGQRLGELHPIRSAHLTHDTTRTIKRTLTLDLGVTDAAEINPVTDRVDVYMIFNQESQHRHPLGRYMFADATRQKYTSGKLANVALTDEMFIVDQPVTAGVGSRNRAVTTVITSVIRDLGISIDFDLESSPYTSIQSWGVGAGRGQILEALALAGDYFSPWFGNDKRLHFIRSFDPAKRVPDFDFDVAGRVLREPIIETDDLLTAPNRFVVISNAQTDTTLPAVGTADVVATAPHSIDNRGFPVTQVSNLQVTDSVQAEAVARNLATRQTVFERVTLSTPPDPLHDSYNVIRWDGELWLELGWAMVLLEGGRMDHVLRKAYR